MSFTFHYNSFHSLCHSLSIYLIHDGLRSLPTGHIYRGTLLHAFSNKTLHLLCICAGCTFLQQVKEIFRSYFDTGAVDRINFDTEIVEGLKVCKYSESLLFYILLRVTVKS